MTNNLSNFRKIGTKIVCVGRNYKEHALELGNVIPQKPMFFVKTTNSYVSEGEPILIPSGCRKMNQEVELGVIFSKLAKQVSSQHTSSFIAGYTVALDMTARDFQDEAKEARAPWFVAKSFDSSCPVAGFVGVDQVTDPNNLDLFCKVNGEDRQRSNTNAMIFKIPTLIEHLTRHVTMYPGDLLLTGTPAGTSVINSGDRIQFGIEGILCAQFIVK